MAFGGKEILLVDGFNVLRCGAYENVVGASPNFTDWTTEEFNNARTALLNDIAQYIDTHTEAYVIFDAKNNPSGEFKTQKFGKINVRFSDFGTTADETIEAICYSALARGFHVKVVTSDHTIRDIVDRKNVTCFSAKHFCSMIKGYEANTAAAERKTQDVAKTSATVYRSSSDPKEKTNNGNTPTVTTSHTAKIEDTIDKQTLQKLEALMKSIENK